MTVADAHVQVAVDAVEMEQVQLLQRLALALLRALDQSADVGGAQGDVRAHAFPDAPPGPTTNAELRRSESHARFSRESLHVDDPPQRDRVAPVLGLQGEGAVPGLAERPLELV